MSRSLSTNLYDAEKLIMRQRVLLVLRRLLTNLDDAKNLVMRQRVLLAVRRLLTYLAIVRCRIVSAAHSGASSAAYVDVGNMDVECEFLLGPNLAIERFRKNIVKYKNAFHIASVNAN